MDYREARVLLNKYWEAETTLEEERKLKVFFASHEEQLPTDLSEAAPLFNFYHEEAAVKMPEWEAPSPWESKKGTVIRQGRLRIARNYWEYAAIFVLVLSSIWLLRPTAHNADKQVAVQDTYDDPQQAMIATQKALEILASNLNKGKNEMQKLALFNEARQKVEGE